MSLADLLIQQRIGHAERHFVTVVKLLSDADRKAYWRNEQAIQSSESPADYLKWLEDSIRLVRQES